jgi:hypothetical protein
VIRSENAAICATDFGQGALEDLQQTFPRRSFTEAAAQAPQASSPKGACWMLSPVLSPFNPVQSPMGFRLSAARASRLDRLNRASSIHARCRCTTRQAFAPGGSSPPTLKDLAAQLKYCPDSLAAPCQGFARSPLVACPRWEYTRRRLERKKRSYAIHYCPRYHASLGGWMCIVRNDPGPSTETTHPQVTRRCDPCRAAASLNRRPTIALMLGERMDAFEMETI